MLLIKILSTSYPGLMGVKGFEFTIPKLSPRFLDSILIKQNTSHSCDNSKTMALHGSWEVQWKAFVLTRTLFDRTEPSAKKCDDIPQLQDLDHHRRSWWERLTKANTTRCKLLVWQQHHHPWRYQPRWCRLGHCPLDFGTWPTSMLWLDCHLL